MATPSAATEPCVIVIFGASGDLTRRKLIPALYDLDRARRLPDKLCVLGVSRTPLSDDQFREKLRESAKQFAKGYDDASWADFARRVHYQPGDAAAGDGEFSDAYSRISARIQDIARERGIVKPSGSPNILFYLSVAPELYERIIANIGASGLVSEGHRWCSLDPSGSSWQRIIVEKPFGTDLATAESLNRALGRVFDEDDTFRIDHYLGKELVQNLLVMRFANTIFEPAWNRNFIDHVQVTAAETVGVGSRAANFYDTAGAMRDMIQSHLLQVLALVAIEPPHSYDGDEIMREKIKLFRSAAAAPTESLTDRCSLGRYGPDPAKNEPAYTGETGVVPDRRTETFAAMRVDFDNWRWAGVPFFLRSGKKMAGKLTEIVVQFKKPPVNIFHQINPGTDNRPANRLIINIAPREGISLRIEGKVPGDGMVIDSAKLDLDYAERFGGEAADAYGPLMLDAVRGDRTLYKHRDEVESGWRICQPFLDDRAVRASIETYAPGAWGPPSADRLISLNAPGRQWHNPTNLKDVR
jgi:glucose-6-phosphate 1-dehydrogenase